MIETTIHQFRTDIPFSLSLIYLSDTGSYAVVFASQDRGVQYKKTRLFTQYQEAWDCYEQNYRYYKGVKLQPVTEEEFQGLSKGTLYPA